MKPVKFHRDPRAAADPKIQDIIERNRLARADNLARRIAKLQKSADELQAIQRLTEAFPDLSLHTDRWERERYTSADVNPRCEQYEILHNCGCCNDSPLELWPYVELDGVWIFAAGIPFTIGERWPNGGEDPWTGWEAKLRDARLPESLITKIAAYFTENPPRPYTDEDEE